MKTAEKAAVLPQGCFRNGRDDAGKAQAWLVPGRGGGGDGANAFLRPTEAGQVLGWMRFPFRQATSAAEGDRRASRERNISPGGRGCLARRLQSS